jgi:phenylalanyl-tRNA synthetase beta chain
MDGRVYAAELDFNTILDFYKDDVKYKQLPKYPAVSRDIAMLLDDSINVYEIEKIIKKCSGNILEGYKLFDVYKGAQIPEGKKSVAYSVTFRASDRTLTDEEITEVFNKILKNLEEKLGAQLR